jgi:hypothetical protein
MDVMSRLTGAALVVLVLVCAGLDQSPADAADAATVLQQMEAKKPDWLPSLDKCPADVMPAQETASGFHEGRCESTLEQCVSNCGAGNAGDCYAAALILQKEQRGSRVPDALFLRACALGVASGCTNRAASMKSGGDTACAVRTFAAACDRNDPWACTMIGMHLVRGVGIDKDHDRARRVLFKSCRYGETDEACRYAKALMKEMGD